MSQPHDDPMQNVARSIEELLVSEVRRRALDATMFKDELRPVIYELLVELVPRVLEDNYPKIVTRVAQSMSFALDRRSMSLDEQSRQREYERRSQ